MSNYPELVVLNLNDARAEIAPGWGAWLLRYRVGEREILHCPQDWLATLPVSGRFGNPLLFPIASSLDLLGQAGAYQHKGKTYQMAQHGFARHLPWKIEEETKAEVVLSLYSCAFTRMMFPWDFVLRVTYRLEPRALVMKAALENKSDEKMPFHFGFHPYFQLDGPQSHYLLRTPESASVTLVAAKSPPVKPQSREVALTSALAQTRLHEGVAPGVFVLEHRQNGPLVEVESVSSEFSTWAIWSPALEAPYVCIEPWTSPPNALNTGRDILPWVEPGTTKTLEAKLTVRG
jgi:galactose mutarotase-like enzyme